MNKSILVGIHEIAEMAEVSASAVINWRKRLKDFPKPITELKSGPVFHRDEIQFWLANRESPTNTESEQFYEHLANSRGDSLELREKVNEVIKNLQQESTTSRRPGMLLGMVQSGKTRAFIGVIARAFDKGYDISVIFTKGTKSLSEQTLSRVKKDFSDFIDNDDVLVFDILSVPELTQYELTKKLIFVVKKEDDNLRRLLTIFKVTYSSLQQRSILFIDDEADLASVSFRRINGENDAGVISRQIDELRDLTKKSAFLQVTATPYSLYLQPEEDIATASGALYKPKRPAFTVVLPTHDKYIGGAEYFEQSTNPESSAYYFFREVPISERDALKKEDRRRLAIEKCLTEKNVEVLRDAIVTFIVGGSIRRIQQQQNSHQSKPQKYSFLFHTESSKKSHLWQERIAAAIVDALVSESRVDSPHFNELIRRSYNDLKRSVLIDGLYLPTIDEVKSSVVDSLRSGHVMITKVNSDNDVKMLLDDNGQFKLRTPLNIFIGGQILDRGITVNNLIAFYYGRNPNRFQQDTVLQHSRMYGARSKDDLCVTRFYAPQHVYHIMSRIHEFDGALRKAFESGDHEGGVYFLQQDPSNRLIPCSPNKLLYSDVISVRPGKRLLLAGFQTVSKTAGMNTLVQLDEKIDQLAPSENEFFLIDKQNATMLLELAFKNLVFEDTTDDERHAHVAILQYLSSNCEISDFQNKVWLMISKNRRIRRYREEGRFSDVPYQSHLKSQAQEKAENVPVLMMFRQDGDDALGWKGLPFWWPVILTPRLSTTMIFANSQAVSPS